MFEYAEKLIAKLPEPELSKATVALEDLLWPHRCWEKFLRPDEKAQVESVFCQEEDFDYECSAVVPTGAMALVKENFNKATGLLLDILLNIVSGKYFSDCQELAAQSGGMIKALQKMGSQEDFELLKGLKIVTDMFDGQSKSISLSNAAPAPSLLTQLTAQGKLDHEADAERDRHWKTVQSERRKFVSFGVPKTWSKDALLASFRACGKIFSHSGQLNSNHRLFCASADLLVEQGEEPWATPSVPPVQLWKEILAFMSSSATGPADFVMAFDGRMREMRRVTAAWLGDLLSSGCVCVCVNFKLEI